jgi:hypothetical protein
VYECHLWLGAAVGQWLDRDVGQDVIRPAALGDTGQGLVRRPKTLGLLDGQTAADTTNSMNATNLPW